MPGTPPARTMAIARLDVGANDDPEPRAFERLAARMATECDVTLTLGAPMRPSDLPPAQHAVALLTGTKAFTLTDADRAAVKAFIAAGGTLFVDAAGGAGAFDASVREQILALLPGAQVGRLTGRADVYRVPGYAIEKVAWRRAARARFVDDVAPRLEGVIVDGRAVILYSPQDVTSGLVGYAGHGLMGYAPQSAFEIMRNVLLYASERKAAAAPSSMPTTEPAGQGSVEVDWSAPR
jgi:hypothetical protein